MARSGAHILDRAAQDGERRMIFRKDDGERVPLLAAKKRAGVIKHGTACFPRVATV